MTTAVEMTPELMQALSIGDKMASIAVRLAERLRVLRKYQMQEREKKVTVTTFHVEALFEPEDREALEAWENLESQKTWANFKHQVTGAQPLFEEVEG